MPAQPERRALRMHPRLLFDVIHRQAGTLSKSVLEGVMNSIDAASARCDITLDQHRLVIEDDGKGFADRTEIDNFFDTFGYPHEEGDATYGRFRMGRGQLFAIGRNLWRTNQFVMDVDLKPQGDGKGDDFQLGYDFREVPDAFPGCRVEVELYDPMNQFTLAQTLRAIEQSVAWAQVPVSLNGRQVSKRPTDARWTLETDDAWINLARVGDLKVYNLGVLVCTLPASAFGTGGVVVSKRRLDINFARNQVVATCPVWKAIGKFIKAEVGRDIAKTRKLDDAGRERLALGVIDGEVPFAHGLRQRLITDVTGAHRMLSSFSPTSYSEVPVTSAPTGDRVGDQVMQRKLALVLSDDTLARFGAQTVDELIAKLRTAAEADMAERGIGPWRGGVRDQVEHFASGLRCLKTVSMDGFRKTMRDTHETVDEKTLTRAEAIVFGALSTVCYTVAQSMGQYMRANGGTPPTCRRLLVGSSDTADGWTDGTGHIWVNRKLLPEARKPQGRSKLAGLLLHEYLHGEPDTETHVHGVEFYQAFHDIVLATGVLHHVAQRIESLIRMKINRADRMAGVDDAPMAEGLKAMGPHSEEETPSMAM